MRGGRVVLLAPPLARLAPPLGPLPPPRSPLLFLLFAAAAAAAAAPLTAQWLSSSAVGAARRPASEAQSVRPARSACNLHAPLSSWPFVSAADLLLGR